MNEATPPQRLHLLGICGTAMAALAVGLRQLGHRVTGTDDKVYPPMSDHLAAQGVAFREGYRAQNIPPDVDLVVVGNVIRRDNPEAVAMRERGLPHLSMAEAVKRFLIGSRTTVAVVGTHGKTTTTALCAHALTALGTDAGFLAGGIVRGAESNFRLGGGRYFVIEGDEYDTAYFDKTPKFFKYAPHALIFTSLEFDHADIYADLDAIRDQFAALLAGMPRDGVVVACADDPRVRQLLPRAACPVRTYGFGEGAGFRLRHWRARDGGATFALDGPEGSRTWRVPLAGRHNALNAAAVTVLLGHLGFAADEVAAALPSFQGVRRRQEVRGEVAGVTVLDDFAHHPTAVRLTIEAIREAYPGRRLWAVFEPRSFTARSARFQAHYPHALADAQRVLLAPPFRGSADGDALDTARVAETLRERGGWAQACESTDEVLATLTGEAAPGDVVLIMSNGGFDGLHERLLQALAARTDAEAGARRQRQGSR